MLVTNEKKYLCRVLINYEVLSLLEEKQNKGISARKRKMMFLPLDRIAHLEVAHTYTVATS